MDKEGAGRPSRSEVVVERSVTDRGASILCWVGKPRLEMCRACGGLDSSCTPRGVGWPWCLPPLADS